MYLVRLAPNQSITRRTWAMTSGPIPSPGRIRSEGFDIGAAPFEKLVPARLSRRGARVKKRGQFSDQMLPHATHPWCMTQSLMHCKPDRKDRHFHPRQSTHAGRRTHLARIPPGSRLAHELQHRAVSARLARLPQCRDPSGARMS